MTDKNKSVKKESKSPDKANNNETLMQTNEKSDSVAGEIHLEEFL